MIFWNAWRYLIASHTYHASDFFITFFFLVFTLKLDDANFISAN